MRGQGSVRNIPSLDRLRSIALSSSQQGKRERDESLGEKNHKRKKKGWRKKTKACVLVSRALNRLAFERLVFTSSRNNAAEEKTPCELISSAQCWPSSNWRRLWDIPTSPMAGLAKERKSTQKPIIQSQADSNYQATTGSSRWSESNPKEEPREWTQGREPTPSRRKKPQAGKG